MIKITFMIFALILFTNNAIALRCVLNFNGSTEETDSVGEVLIPKNAKKGEVIWRKADITKRVKCNDASPAGDGEFVYFYYFPEDNLKLPEGMTFGIKYNHEEIDLDTSSSVNNRKIKTNIWVRNKNAEEPDKKEVIEDIIYDLYIKKTGEINVSGFSGKLPIFQLDGIGGINGSEPNYKHYLEALNNISDVDCSFTYQRKAFDIDINNNLTLRPQQVSIGDYAVTCTPQDKMKGHTITYSVPNDSDDLPTNLDGLNYRLKVNNSAVLDSLSRVKIQVHGLFKLDYKDQNWLYDSNSKLTIPSVTLIPELKTVN